MMTEPIETTRDIDTLAPHPRNYNQHPPAQIARIAKSLVQFGQVRPIVVHGDTIIAGHGVYMAAAALADPVVNEAMLRGYVFDDTTHTYEQWCEHRHDTFQSLRVTQLPDDWTEEQALAYLVADNETRRGAEPNDAELAALLDELQQADFDIAAMGFDDAEYSALLEELTPDLPEPGSGGDEFEPDESAPCRVQSGDVWLIGGVHRLICGDCTDPATVERLMQGERADAVVTDSPYGINREGIANDNPEGLRGLFDGMLAVLPVDNSVVINFQSPRLLHVWFDAVKNASHNIERVLWMYKPNDETFPWRGWLLKSEAIAVSSVGKGQWQDIHPYAHDVYSPTTLGKELPDGVANHASVKPMAVISDLIQRVCPDNRQLYDPFLGSGTTIIAAHRTGRRCYGCEISPEYCEIILQRCEAEGLTVERVEQG
jgi:DNA modification methylase